MLIMDAVREGLECGSKDAIELAMMILGRQTFVTMKDEEVDILAKLKHEKLVRDSATK